MYTDSDGYLSEKGSLQFMSGAIIVVGALLILSGVGTAAGIILVGAGIGSIVGGEVSEALGGSYVLGWTIGGTLGGFGGEYFAPVIEGVLSSTFTLGFCANLGRVISAVTVTGAQVIGSAGAIIGIDIMFMSKDPYISYKERGMTPGQRDIFQRLIENEKKSVGRGGADNLPHDLIDQIAEYVLRFFTGK